MDGEPEMYARVAVKTGAGDDQKRARFVEREDSKASERFANGRFFLDKAFSTFGAAMCDGEQQGLQSVGQRFGYLIIEISGGMIKVNITGLRRLRLPGKAQH